MEYLKWPTPIECTSFLPIRFLKNRESIKVLDRGLSVTSRKRHLSTLKNFFGFLCEKYPKNQRWQRGFKRNPVLKRLHTIRVKDEDFTHTPLLRAQHWERLMETPLKLQDKLFLGLMYWGGLRVSEVRNLRRDQLEFDTNVLTFIRKGGKRHHLFLQDNGACSLLWQRMIFKEADLDRPLFSNRFKTGALNRRGAYKRVKKAFQKAGLPQNLSPHSLRKACASRLYYQTKDLLFVRDYLGHSDAKVTQTYIETQGISLDVRSEDNPGGTGTNPTSFSHRAIETSSSLSIQ